MFCIYTFTFSFLGEGHREECFIKLRLCKKKLAQVSSLGDHDFTCSNGSDRACLPSQWNRSFVLNELSLEPLLFILGLFPFWLLQGGTEEVATRGWLLTRIAARTNLPLAIAISSSLFGILHMGNEGVTFLSVLNIILDGVLAGLLFIYTDSIWLVVAQHGTWNYVQGNLLGFQVSGTGADASIFSFTMGDGPDWLTGGAFGAEGSIITTLVLLVSLVIVYRLGERKEKFVD